MAGSSGGLIWISSLDLQAMSQLDGGEELPQLSLEALALSPAEERAYPRWYTDLLLRKRSEAVAIGDILKFVDNFGLSDADKDRIVKMFGQTLVTLDPPQFYAFLRLASHVLGGKPLRRELAFVTTDVIKPRSILRRQRAKETLASSRVAFNDADDDPFRRPEQPAAQSSDMDSFVSLMTGRARRSMASAAMPSSQQRNRPQKRVTFDSNPPEIAEAAHRSMKELLRQRVRQVAPPLPPPPPPPPPQLARQPLQNQYTGEEKDAPLPTNHFASVNIDSVLLNGHPVTPPQQPSTSPSEAFLQSLTTTSSHQTSNTPLPPPQRLTPNRTGPTEMASFGAIPQGGSLSSVNSDMFSGISSASQYLPRPVAQMPNLLSPQIPSHLQQQNLSPQISGISPQVSGNSFTYTNQLATQQLPVRTAMPLQPQQPQQQQQQPQQQQYRQPQDLNLFASKFASQPVQPLPAAASAPPVPPPSRPSAADFLQSVSAPPPPPPPRNDDPWDPRGLSYELSQLR